MRPHDRSRGPRAPFGARLLVLLLVPARHREFVLGDLDEEFAAVVRSTERWSVARRRYWRLALASVLSSWFRRRRRRRRPRPRPIGYRRSRGGSALNGWVHGWWRDVVYGARLLRRRPGFAVVAMLTLGLGLGATTAVFSVANGLLLRPVPGVADPDQLVTIEFSEFRDTDLGRLTGISPHNLADLDAAATTLTGMAAWQFQSLQVQSADGRPLQVTGEAVAGDYFGVLGVRPQLGRVLNPAESQPGRPRHVAVISASLWRELFGGDRDVIGRVVRMNRYPITIVGVVPDGFHGAERGGRAEVWFPSSIYAQLRHFGDPERLNSRGSGFLRRVAGRLAPGATVDMAQAQLQQLMERLVAAYPDDNESYGKYRPWVVKGVGLIRLDHQYLERTVRLMLAVVAFVLVIACANVANMLLARGVERRGEAAVRRALGATGARLMRQQVAESLLLGLLSALLGTGIAFAFRAVFRVSNAWSLLGAEVAPFDVRVYAFAMLAALSTGLLFGLVPTALSRRLDLTGSLKEVGGRETRPRARMRSAITVLQLALSITLLVGALLLTRTLLNLYAVDLGFETRGVYSVTINTEPQGYDDARRHAFEAALLDRLETAAGVEAAALTASPPFGGGELYHGVRHPADAERSVDVVVTWVSPGYFDALRTPIIAGRGIGPEDLGVVEGNAPNVVISEALAHELFGSERPIGRTVMMPQYRAPDRELRIVGVAANKRLTSLTSAPEALIYEPINASLRYSEPTVALVRTSHGLRHAESVVRDAVDALDPALPLTRAQALEDGIERHLSEERLFAKLLVVLASIAMLMAAVGLYGVVAGSVAERTREIGIRMALGAHRRRVLALVLKQAAALVVTGTVLGLSGAVVLTRVIENRLFGVDRLDPAVYAAAAALFALVALAATVVPARRATGVDPMLALRHE